MELRQRHHFSGITLFAHARGRLGFILFQVLALELGFHSSAVFRFSVICNSCLFVATPKMNYFCSIQSLAMTFQRILMHLNLVILFLDTLQVNCNKRLLDVIIQLKIQSISLCLQKLKRWARLSCMQLLSRSKQNTRLEKN